MERYFVYIIRSLKDNTLYIGFSTNIDRRVAEHNSGLSRYTSAKAPWVLFYVEELSSKRDALKREKFLKTQRNRDSYERLVLEQDQ